MGNVFLLPTKPVVRLEMVGKRADRKVPKFEGCTRVLTESFLERVFFRPFLCSYNALPLAPSFGAGGPFCGIFLFVS